MTAGLDIEPFCAFADAFDPARYRAVPDDWQIAVSDVVSSSEAIARGRYKDVNMAGAATIAGVLNACGRDDLPFAFGGDGGIVLVPAALAAPAGDALRATQRLCADTMGLDLRASLIPVAAIRARGKDVRVAAHDLGSGRLLAMLAGGGIDLAETLCKSEDGAPFVVAPGGGDADLSGLSCRWQPFEPANGLILALLVRARGDASPVPAIYRTLYRRIADVLGTDYSPARASAYRLRWPPAGLTREAALNGPGDGFRRAARILVESAAMAFSLASGKPVGGFDARAYRASLPGHSDYRKYADSLRMVIDCTPDQAARLTAILAAEWRAGRIDYGTHSAPTALMTCFVKNTEDTGHIHFIDGSDGGYALAAADMKKRAAG